jgi:hypothetical protein
MNIVLSHHIYNPLTTVRDNSSGITIINKAITKLHAQIITRVLHRRLILVSNLESKVL